MTKTLASRLAAIIAALAVLLGAAGCSAIKLGYETLPELAYWWLDGYLDFSDEQRPQVREELRRLQTWHRRHELPAVAELLARLEPLAAGPAVSAQQACAVVAEARTRLERVADRAALPAGSLALTLTPAQLRHLERQYRKKNAEWAREWLEGTPEERFERRLKQATKRAETFYGRLDPPQRALLREHLARSAFDPQRALAQRQRRQQDLLVLLKALPASPGEAGQRLRAAVQQSLRPTTAEAAALQQTWIEEGCSLVAALHASASPVQRERAVQRLREYRRDVLELAGERVPDAPAPAIQ